MPSFMTLSTPGGVGHAFHQAENRLVDHRHQHAVGNESGKIVHAHRSLARGGGERHGLLNGFGRGLKARHHLHQLHHRHGIEKVQAYEVAGPVGGGGEARDGN